MKKMDDPYEILGVEFGADESTIKKAYRKAALKYHPDRQTSEGDEKSAHDTFTKISGAYDILMDPVKRFDWSQGRQCRQQARRKSLDTAHDRQQQTVGEATNPPRFRGRTTSFTYGGSSPQVRRANMRVDTLSQSLHGPPGSREFPDQRQQQQARRTSLHTAHHHQKQTVGEATNPPRCRGRTTSFSYGCSSPQTRTANKRVDTLSQSLHGPPGSREFPDQRQLQRRAVSREGLQVPHSWWTEAPRSRALEEEEEKERRSAERRGRSVSRGVDRRSTSPLYANLPAPPRARAWSSWSRSTSPTQKSHNHKKKKEQQQHDCGFAGSKLFKELTRDTRHTSTPLGVRRARKADVLLSPAGGWVSCYEYGVDDNERELQTPPRSAQRRATMSSLPVDGVAHPRSSTSVARIPTRRNSVCSSSVATTATNMTPAAKSSKKSKKGGPKAVEENPIAAKKKDKHAKSVTKMKKKDGKKLTKFKEIFEAGAEEGNPASTTNDKKTPQKREKQQSSIVDHLDAPSDRASSMTSTKPKKHFSSPAVLSWFWKSNAVTGAEDLDKASSTEKRDKQSKKNRSPMRARSVTSSSSVSVPSEQQMRRTTTRSSSIGWGSPTSVMDLNQSTLACPLATKSSKKGGANKNKKKTKTKETFHRQSTI